MKRKSDCPTNFALEHFGDKWSLLIIRDLMFNGKRHYNEFFEAEEKISTSVLGTKLKDLVANGIISKGKDSVKKSRIRYSLTPKGIALLPVMVDLIVWSAQFDDKTAAAESFIQKAQREREALLEELKIKLEKEHLDEKK